MPSRVYEISQNCQMGKSYLPIACYCICVVLTVPIGYAISFGIAYGLEATPPRLDPYRYFYPNGTMIDPAKFYGIVARTGGYISIGVIIVLILMSFICCGGYLAVSYTICYSEDDKPVVNIEPDNNNTCHVADMTSNTQDSSHSESSSNTGDSSNTQDSVHTEDSTQINETNDDVIELDKMSTSTVSLSASSPDTN